MGRRRRHTQFGESAIMNNYSYTFYLDRLTELALAMFEWKNLPETVDPRYLEMILFNQGRGLFFEDEVMGYLSLRMTTQGGFDVYHNPVRRRAYADNGYNRVLDESNSVIIYNNYLKRDSFRDMQYYAMRIWDLDNTIATNCKAQKTPVLVQGSETQRLTLLNLYQQFDGNAPVIFGDQNLDINSIKVLRTDAPFVADRLYELKQQLWCEALTCLGITNVNNQKRERMVTSEVSSNNGSTIANRYSRLVMRRQACEEINRMFNLDIWCDFREDFEVIDPELNQLGIGEDTTNNMGGGDEV